LRRANRWRISHQANLQRKHGTRRPKRELSRRPHGTTPTKNEATPFSLHHFLFFPHFLSIFSFGGDERMNWPVAKESGLFARRPVDTQAFAGEKACGRNGLIDASSQSGPVRITCAGDDPRVTRRLPMQPLEVSAVERNNRASR
jgi:hypothetical protein